MEVTENSEGATAIEERPTESVSNPHNLQRQLIGMGLVVGAIGGLFGFLGGGIPGVLLTWTLGGATFADAWRAGIHKSESRRSLINMSPMGWGIAMAFILILAYPLYLLNRGRLRTRETGNGLFALVIVLGGLVILSFVVGILVGFLAPELTSDFSS